MLLLQEINEAAGIESVHEAFRLGINFFDTSPFYGTTKSETVSLCFCCSAEQLNIQARGACIRMTELLCV
jgi:predicted aldo/keto reductase-like oxidoreductase